MKLFQNKEIRLIFFVVISLTIFSYFVSKTYDSILWYWLDIFIGAIILIAVGYVILKDEMMT